MSSSEGTSKDQEEVYVVEPASEENDVSDGSDDEGTDDEEDE